MLNIPAQYSSDFDMNIKLLPQSRRFCQIIAGQGKALSWFRSYGLCRDRLPGVSHTVAAELLLLRFIKFFDNTTWTEHNTQYNIGTGGDDNVFTMFARNREAKQVSSRGCAQLHTAYKNFSSLLSRVLVSGAPALVSTGRSEA